MIVWHLTVTIRKLIDDVQFSGNLLGNSLLRVNNARCIIIEAAKVFVALLYATDCEHQCKQLLNEMGERDIEHSVDQSIQAVI